MAPDDFFNERREQSLIKTMIVKKFLRTWSSIIMGSQDHNKWVNERRIGYIDLFAGKGRYDDGSPSTPVEVVELAISDPKLADRLIMIFTDKDPVFTSALKHNLNAIPGIERMRYRPQVHNLTVDQESAEAFASINSIPMLSFVDPCGYKGLSRRLVDSLLKGWGM